MRERGSDHDTQLPFPWRLVPPEGVRLTTVDFFNIMEDLVQKNAAIAGSLVGAAQSDETAEQERAAAGGGWGLGQPACG